MVGRVLNVQDAVIDQIDADEFKVSEKCYRKCNCVVSLVIKDFTMLRSIIVFRGHQTRQSCLASIKVFLSLKKRAS